MIDVKELYYSYPGSSRKTIKGLNFFINQGEIFGFLGPSGAGKSTTQKIIIGILKNYQGNVTVKGKEIKATNSSFYEQVGIAFEFPNLFNKFTALENLEYSRSLYTVETQEPEYLLSLVGLDGDARTRVSEYSKGMKQRLSFCRALLNNPEIIFLDEPTAGLDPINARKIMDIILERKKEGKTIFLTTHNMHVAEELCDRVAFIVDGRIVLIDSPRELKIKKGTKKAKIEYQDNGKVKTVEYELARIGWNKEFLYLLKEKEIETIHSQEANLDEIFIEVTGRRLV